MNNRYRIKKITHSDGSVRYFIEVRYFIFFWSHTTREGYVESDMADPLFYDNLTTIKEKIDEFMLRDSKNREEEKRNRIKKTEIIKYP